jgi:hypothetical protein
LLDFFAQRGCLRECFFWCTVLADGGPLATRDERQQSQHQKSLHFVTTLFRKREITPSPVQDGRRRGIEQSCHHQELAGMTRHISKDFTAAQNATVLVGAFPETGRFRFDASDVPG